MLSWVVGWKLLKGGISPEMRPAPNDQQPKLVTSFCGGDDHYYESDYGDIDENNDENEGAGRKLKMKKACPDLFLEANCNKDIKDVGGTCHTPLLSQLGNQTRISSTHWVYSDM